MKTRIELLAALKAVEAELYTYLDNGGEVGTPEYRAFERKSDAICYVLNALLGA